jgi:hypothetical protein
MADEQRRGHGHNPIPAREERRNQASPTDQPGRSGGGGDDRNPTESPAVACLIDGLWLRQLEQRS